MVRWCSVHVLLGAAQLTSPHPEFPRCISRVQGSQACDDVVEIYKLYLKDKEVAGGPGWDGVGSSLPCTVFRTLYKAKRYEEALAYLEDALSARK